MRIEDVSAVVTGGASGLGLGVVRMLAAAGARVAILDRLQSNGASLATGLGPAVAFTPADVTRPDQVREAIDGAVQHLRRINVLVSCAGITADQRVVTRSGRVMPLEFFRAQVDTNLVGLFDVIRHCAAEMCRADPLPSGERGVIINLASMAAHGGQVGQAAYSASKGGVVALTLPLARDLADFGIRVNTISPGIMDTPQLDAKPEELKEELPRLPVFPKRFGTPADLAGAVRMLIEQEFINGTVIHLDAGARL